MLLSYPTVVIPCLISRIILFSSCGVMNTTLLTDRNFLFILSRSTLFFSPFKKEHLDLRFQDLFYNFLIYVIVKFFV